MSFDTQTRNRLASFVGKCRKLLCGDFKTPGGEMARLLAHYGIQDTGDCFAVDTLTHLDEPGRETARTLRAILEHKQSTAPKAKVWKKFDPAVYDLIQEQGFTVLNRLCALRMAEERQLVFPCVSKGLQSDGFQLYEYHTGKANAEITPELRYQHFLFSLFDELSLDLGSLFDRFSPQGLLFPGTQALAELLEELNHPELAALWGEDETIGWIYQYWNSQEERKAMRDASPAPRNSRELAVRNQFFTPRYVVQFLSENTLGRAWYEMTQGNTALKDNCTYLVRRPSEVFLAEGEEAPEQASTDNESLSQAEQLKQPVHIPFRPLKDPREIRLLDPACGSMHFGLYAFDLFETIYSEAWDLNAASLREDFPTKEALLLEMPRLIIEHNIHGVDIDPRATQIAGLALWLRAQRTWKNQKVSATERPKVKRSNIVCAEPMPGDQDQLAEFTAKLHPAIAQMVTHIFEKMQLAGEAGSLLKIEEEITALVDEAKAAWQKIGKHEGEMFSMAEIINADGRSGTQQILDTGDWNVSTLSSISHRDFFEKAESEIYAQLARYAETVGSGSYKRKLFANDAAHGFAFIDLCNKRYDAAVMNPPFGPIATGTNLILKQYQSFSDNIAAPFAERGLKMSSFVGIVLDRSLLVRKTHEKFRLLFLDKCTERLAGSAIYGWGVLDANVEVAGLVASDLPNRFSYSLSGTESIDQIQWVENKGYQALPNTVISGEIPDFILNSFAQHNSLSKTNCSAKVGNQWKSERYLRLWWECKELGQLPTYNGGAYTPYEMPTRNTMSTPCDDRGLLTESSTVIRNASSHGKPGVGYGKRGIFLDAHILPAGQTFTVEGLACHPATEEDRWKLLAFLNSSCVSTMLSFYCGQHKHVGYLNRLPFSNSWELGVELLELLQKEFKNKRQLSAIDETCLLFSRFTFTEDFNGLREEAQKFCRQYAEVETSSLRLADQIDKVVSKWLGFPSDWAEDPKIAIFLENKPKQHLSGFFDEAGVDSEYWFASRFIGLMFGTCVGQLDIRYATGERQPPELGDPFAPLPVCPPGMLQDASNNQLANVDLGALNREGLYPLRVTIDGIIVDDVDHSEDLIRRMRESFQVGWKDKAAAIEQEACDILDVNNLREYFIEGKAGSKFFKDHLKRYSKSRRKAPIYWPLSTESGTYTLWLYYHRLSANTLYTAVTQFIEPKQEEAQETFAKLNAKQGRSQAEDKELEAAQQLVAELATFRESLLEIAQFWKPDLNDGVQITAAPLWKHFRLKSWQKTLKDTWSKLEHGDYDWAHLSHSIWPDRVINKCITDRSLAIAHGHDEALWVEVPDAKGKSKWQARQNAEDIAEELIQALKN